MRENERREFLASVSSIAAISALGSLSKVQFARAGDPPSKKLNQKVALVTGASRGIGREIALLLASEGAQVILVGRSLTDLEETARLMGPDRNSIPILCDLRDERSIEALALDIERRFPFVDILVNAAGVWHDGASKFHGPNWAETPSTQVHEILETGIRGSMLLSKALLPSMMKRRSGKILQIACGFAGPHEAAGWIHYYVNNKAIEAFTQGLAAELRESQIQVNCIAPWYVATEYVQKYFPDETPKALALSEIAKLALFLVSSDSDSISGQVIELRSKADI